MSEGPTPFWPCVMVLCLQGLSVVEQEKLDNLMLQLDGTENKCKWGPGKKWGG